MQYILAKIFRAQTRGFQVWFAYIGFAVGMLILLFALQLYGQLSVLFHNPQKMGGYLLISKSIGMGNTLFFSKPTFSAGEQAELVKQPFIEKVAPLVANQFEVMAYIQRLGFSTELFFEAVDKSALDTQPEGFTWKEGQPKIPIILGKDMLDLYNFGFAVGKGGGMPQISMATAQLVTIGLRIRGERGEQNFVGQIVGFSERVSSILVPMEFMEWANTRMGAGKVQNPSRILLKVRHTASPELASHIAEKGYQVNEDRLRAGKVGGIVQNLMSIVGFIGVLFVLLSGVLFLMNFRAILAEARQEIGILLELGYTPQMLTQFLIQHFVKTLSIVMAVIFVGMYAAENYTTALLKGRGLEVGEGIFWWVWVSGICLACLAVCANYWNIQRHIYGKYA